MILQKLTKFCLDVIPARLMSTKISSIIDFSTDNEGICTLTLQRPPVNSLNLELLQDLSTSLDEIENDGIKGLVLTSAFSKVFSAGLDINELHEPQLERFTSFSSTLQDVWIKLFGSSFVSTAAITGHSPAGGCILALACEYRAMVRDRTIGINDTILGIAPAKWIVESTRLAMSSRQAELALTTSKMYTTDEALKVGLIDAEVADKEEAIEKCKEFIKKFDKIPSFARIQTKNSIRGPILRILTDNRNEDLNNNIKKIYDVKTQNDIRGYFMQLKAKKEKSRNK